MEAKFFGTYEHTLDGKGRLILPAKFRREFTGDAVGYLSQSSDHCLNLWTPPAFRERMQKMRLQASRGRVYRNVARLWAAGVAEIQVDSQGRIPVPAHLRSFAQLQGEVLVIGGYEKVELWSPAIWREKVLSEENDVLRNDFMENLDVEGARLGDQPGDQQGGGS